MNRIQKLSTLFALSSIFCSTASISAEPIILSETAAQNLGIETQAVEVGDFTETVFAIGHIEAIPARKSILSSRIPGRIASISAHEGDKVEAGQVIAEVESLQPGNPPPSIPLTAPTEGLVLASHTHLGKPVSTDSGLFEIVDLSEVYAIANLPEAQAGHTRIGTLASITIPAISDQAIQGTLIRYGTEANGASGTLKAYFLLENPELRIRPNMRTEFSIVLQQRPNVTSVPKSSIQSDGVNQYVFVEDYDLPNAYVKVPLITGSRNRDRVEVKKGLFPGDRVVVQGSYPLMYATTGTISLKEALDAAHGHEHNADGSEMTAAQKAQASSSGSAGQNASNPFLLTFLIASNTLTLILLLLSLIRRKTKA